MKKSVLITIVPLVMLALSPFNMVKAQFVDENTSWNSIILSAIGQTGSNFYAQSFYAHVNTITRFGVVIQEIESEGQLILSIAADDGTGKPNVAAPLYQGTLQNPTTSGAWFYETGISVNVTVGQKYWILIDGYNNAGATGKSGVGRSDSYTGTGEGVLYSNTAGSSWSSIPTMALAIYVEGIKPATIDENNGWNNNVVSSIGATGSDFYAQSFYAGVDIITRFGAVLREIDPEGQLVLSIVADNGSGAPDVGAPLYQGPLRNPTTTGAWFYETGLSIPVTMGQKYWVLIDGYNNQGATGRSAVGLSGTSTDTGEGMLYSNSAGVGYWSSISSMTIAIYVEGINAAIIDENNGANLNYVSSLGASGSDFYAQSFYADVDVLKNFGVVLQEIDAGGEVLLAIAGDNGSGYPNVSAPLYQGSLLNPSTTGAWFYETGLNIPLTIGAKYWVVVDGYNNPGATGRSAVGLSSGYTGTGAGMLFTNTGGVGIWSSIPSMTLAIFVDGQRASRLVTDTSVTAGESACFDATGTLTVGGSAGPVVFWTGSTVDLIAGYSVLIEPGFYARSGSNIHAYITPNSSYCSVPPGVAAPSGAYKNSVVASTTSAPDDPREDQRLKIYPNPNNGVFTVETVNLELPAVLSISDAIGEVLLQANQMQGDPARFDLSRFRKGLYLVRVSDGKSVITRKMIVQ
jgi:hypothetical protein